MHLLYSAASGEQDYCAEFGEVGDGAGIRYMEAASPTLEDNHDDESTAEAEESG